MRKWITYDPKKQINSILSSKCFNDWKKNEEFWLNNGYDIFVSGYWKMKYLKLKIKIKYNTLFTFQTWRRKRNSKLNCVLTWTIWKAENGSNSIVVFILNSSNSKKFDWTELWNLERNYIKMFVTTYVNTLHIQIRIRSFDLEIDKFLPYRIFGQLCHFFQLYSYCFIFNKQ